jgi:hypothetical protein
MLRVFVITSDRYTWALAPFAHLFNSYWSELQPVVVAGYSQPPFPLPRNFEFHRIDYQNYPAEKWSNGIIKFLTSVPDTHFVLMLEDYWLTRTVDAEGVKSCYQYMKERPDILRFDLTDDRQYNGKSVNIGGWGHYDLVESPIEAEYRMSTQAGIWNKKLMLDLLVPDKSAWEVEIHTSPPENMRVLGTRQSPVRYANALLKGQIDTFQISRIPQEHYNYVVNMIPDEYKQAS